MFGLCMRKSLLGALALLCMQAPPASADEIRLGVMVHNADFFSGFLFLGRRGQEDSISLSAEYVWDSPDFLSWALKARPYVGGSLNLAGNTSHAGAGLLWRQGFLNKFYAEYAVGVVVHNGSTRIPRLTPPVDPVERANRIRRLNTEIQFGSRVLFRLQAALGYRFNEKWAGEIVYEHLSHAQLFGRINQGSDSFGFRVSRRF